MKSIPLLSLAAAAGFLASCGNTTTPTNANPSVAAYQAFDVPAKLPNNPSAVRVKVSLKNQAAYVMENGKPLLVMPVSIGTASSPTPRGNFTIYSKEAKRRANTHGWAYNSNGQAKQVKLGGQPRGWNFTGTPMPYWSEFKSAYGFHTGWQKPYPCTHGCIRMHENVAPKFYRIISEGTPVNISYTQPEDATIGRDVPRAPDAGPLPDYPASMYIGDGYFNRHKTPTFN
jgi:lipoprotein-anchoring transpeptidase ErfK/SrfK